ncbi:chemotaxis protein CheW [Paenibacillus sp. FSL K6-1096]|uniref:chemotaxis protein CheW n=1 Tax=Paenibacillus sp. FSL K6-1096 TaxID=2921460 RepID=UPI0030EE4162
MKEFQNLTYLGAFLDEMEEQLQYLDEALLVLESKGYQNDIIQRIFRAAHTLKGSSAVMGFKQLNRLTHQMESVLELLRDRQLEVSSALLNTFFDCVDFIKQLREAILNGVLEEGDTSALLQRLKEVRRSAAAAPAAPGAASALPVPAEVELPPEAAEPAWSRVLDADIKERIKASVDRGLSAVAVQVQLADGEQMKVVRAKLVETKLQELGEVAAAYPELNGTEREEQFSGTAAYILLTRQPQQEIIASLKQISQIGRTQVDPFTIPELDPSAAEQADSRNSVHVAQTVRVDVERLEGLLNLVGELIIDNTRLHSVRTRLNEQLKGNSDIHLLNDIAGHLNMVISDLQEGMMKTRMLPIEHLFGRFPRMIRDLGQRSGKEIDFIIEGKETELDRSLIEEISDPLIHILRNSVDHGLELPEERAALGKPRKGTIVLRASHQGNMIVITISDDGRGIDTGKVKETAVRKGFVTAEEAGRMTDKELVMLIFRSGISTARKVTDLSGRGVGMDIVKAHIEKLNGVIDIETVPGQGSVFTIKLPLTLAIIRSLLVKLGASTFAVPLINVIEIFRMAAADIVTIQGQEVCTFRDQVLPLLRLHPLLQIEEGEGESQADGRLFAVIVGYADKRVCLVVDQTIGNQEIVIKSLGSYIGNVPYIAGSTILGDGQVAHILDIGSIVRESGSAGEAGRQEKSGTDGSQDPGSEKYITFKLDNLDFGIPIRQMKEIVPVPEIHPLVSAPEHVLGMINLRGLLFPVYDIRPKLEMGCGEQTDASRILICEVSGQEAGIWVDRVSAVQLLAWEHMDEAPEHILRNAGVLDAVYKDNHQFIHLLNLEHLLDLDACRTTGPGLHDPAPV